MNQVMERLRQANECMETELRTVSAGDVAPSPDELWALLARAAEFVQQLGPAVNEICRAHQELIGDREIQRYGVNLKRMQLACAGAVERLTGRRTELWQEEQCLRAQHAWQPEY